MVHTDASMKDCARETVRRRLAEDDLKPWLRKMWCIPQVDGTYIARMEEVLDLYAEEADARRPVVCFDESPTQLIGEVREPISAAPGQPERYDCEYRRNGTANLFVFLDAHKSWRHVKVTDRRTACDFADCMRELADVHYPDADRIRWRWTTFPLTRPGHCMRHSRHRRHTACFSAWNFITHRSTRVAQHGGDRVACCAVNVWIAELVSATSLSPRSRRGSSNATRPARASNGSSPRKRRETSWHSALYPDTAKES